MSAVATAYVTGADRGLGLALSRLLLERGCFVFAGTYMPDWPELDELQAAYPNRLLRIPLDVTDEASVRQAAEAIADRTAHLDYVFNNAAIFTDRSGSLFEQLHTPDMLKLYDTNTLGPLRVTHSILPLLLAGSAKKLVFISSEAGSISRTKRTREFGYCMSKAALNMQAAITQNELRPHGVKVLAFHPGWLKTYMKGVRDEAATMEAIDSARGIMRIVDSSNEPDGPIYLDYAGNVWPW